jgi:hypothetical protein
VYCITLTYWTATRRQRPAHTHSNKEMIVKKTACSLLPNIQSLKHKTAKQIFWVAYIFQFEMQTSTAYTNMLFVVMNRASTSSETPMGFYNYSFLKFFNFLNIMNFDVCDVTLRVHPHRASWKVNCLATVGIEPANFGILVHTRDHWDILIQ